MPVEVTRLPGEPIIHALFTGKIGNKDVLEMFRLSVELAHDIPGKVYRITETRDLEVSFTDVMFILRDMSEGQPGSSIDPRFEAVLAGTDAVLKFVADSSHQEQYKKLNLPIFATFDEALVFVRQQIANDG